MTTPDPDDPVVQQVHHHHHYPVGYTGQPTTPGRSTSKLKWVKPALIVTVVMIIVWRVIAFINSPQAQADLLGSAIVVAIILILDAVFLHGSVAKIIKHLVHMIFGSGKKKSH